MSLHFLIRCCWLQDGEIRKAFQRSLGKQGMKFKLGIKVNSAELKNGGVELKMESAKGGKEETVQADIVLVSAGGLSRLIGGLYLAGQDTDGTHMVQVSTVLGWQVGCIAGIIVEVGHQAAMHCT